MLDWEIAGRLIYFILLFLNFYFFSLVIQQIFWINEAIITFPDGYEASSFIEK